MSIATAETSWIPRYASREDALAATLAEIPDLVRQAWNHALLFPELGGEGIDDLLADVKEIVARESEVMVSATAAAERRIAAAERIGLNEQRAAERKLAEGLMGIAAEGVADGIDPVGCFVYLLWEHKEDKVPVYVGKSVNLLGRLGDHMRSEGKRYRVRWITLIRCRTQRQMDATEARLIRRYRPELNTAGIPADERY